MKLLFAKEDARALSVDDGAAVYLSSIIFILLVQVLGSFVLVFLPLADGESEMTVNLLLMCVLQMANLGAVLIAVGRKKLALPYAVRPIKWYGYALSVLTAPVCIICFVLLGNWFVILLENIGYNFAPALEFTTPTHLFLAILATVILAPVCEEMVYRGALLGGLTKKIGAIPALILSSLCFSLMHMNPEQTVYQFCLGFVAGYLAICTRSILPSILLHATNNLIAIATSFIPTVEGGESVPFDPISTIIATVVLVGVGIALVYLIGRLVANKKGRTQLCEEKEKAKEEETEIEEGVRPSPSMGKKTWIILIAIGLGLCIFTWALVFLVNMLPIA